MSDSDMRAVIVPKSNQLNADSLIGGPLTITITEVQIRPGTEQPVSIFYTDHGGKPYMPCKSMARVMVHCWGPDANQYIGKSMTLFNDPKVKWAGVAVGGIRISHIAGITAPVTMALTETKGNKKLFTVQPLVQRPANPTRDAEPAPAAKPIPSPPPVSENVAQPKRRTRRDFLNELQSTLAACHTIDEVDEVAQSDDVVAAIASFTAGALDELNALLAAAIHRTQTDPDPGTADSILADAEDDFPGDK